MCVWGGGGGPERLKIMLIEWIHLVQLMATWLLLQLYKAMCWRRVRSRHF